MKPRVFSAGDAIGVALAIAVFAVFFFVPTTEAEPPNSVPHIEALRADCAGLYPGDGCDLKCYALDTDGDELTYTWSSEQGSIEPSGDYARWTAPAVAGPCAVTVEVADGKGGRNIASAVIDVLENREPEINGLWFERDSLLPGESTALLCTASDADDHALSYEWTCTSGEIVSTGAQSIWTAPRAPGTYLVAVRADDAHGGSQVRTLLVSVYSPEPPVIEQLLVRPLLPDYTKQTNQGFRLLRGSETECEIECAASGGSKELVYEWSTTGGDIEGEGPVVLFVPPSKPAEVVVSVTVYDSFHHSAYSEVFFDVLNREKYADDDIGAGCNCHPS